MGKSKKSCKKKFCKACRFSVVIGGKVKCSRVIQERYCKTFTRKST